MTVRLDEMIPEGTHVRLIKSDTEGAELLVMGGAIKVLPTTDAILVECYDVRMKPFGYAAKDLSSFLVEQGFQPYAYKDGWNKVPEAYSEGEVDFLFVNQRYPVEVPS